MDLWVGNATRQIYVMGYKVPDIAQPRTLKLEPGRQDRIRDLTSDELDYIVRCHSIYGMIHENAVDQTKTFAGTCYSVDKPITSTRLSYLMDHNLGELVEQGRQIRKENAVAQSQNISRHLEESNRPERVDYLEVTVQQEKQDPKNDVPQMSVGTLVTEDENMVPPGQGRRRGPRGGAAAG